MSVKGLDISNNQTQAINFAALKADGIGFVFHKATEGMGFTDPYLAERWKAMAAAGLVRGQYHFARPDQAGSNPTSEAEHFLTTIAHDAPLAPGDLVALDLETGVGDLSEWAGIWLGAVEKALGFRPLLYTYSAFVTEHIHDAALSQYPLWLASWQANEPAAPAPFRSISLWQDSANARYPGLPTVDEDTEEGTLAQLKALGKPAPISAPKPTPQEFADEGWLHEVDLIVTGVPVRSATARRAALKAFLAKHPA